MRRILCLIKHHATKTYGGVEVYLHVLLTCALDRLRWMATFTSRQIYPR